MSPVFHTRVVSFSLLVFLAFHATISSAQTGPRLDVPFVPTPQEVVDRMLEMAEVTPDDYLIDLGSGDGRIVITAVRDRNVKQALGIDLDPERIAEARDNARRAGLSRRAKFHQADVFKTDFSNATVLTMYLLQTVNERLRPTILKELAPGTRVVSHAFDMGEWRADKTDTVNGRDIYLWIVPARVAGRWQLTTEDGEEIPLSLVQAFQQIQGTAIVNGSEVRLEDPLLRGNLITFSIDRKRYSGIVNGDNIEPRVAGDTESQWNARRTEIS